jgi:predicted ArsR family transcriptional regulator
MPTAQVNRRRRHLSAARAAVMDVLIGQPQPCTVAALSAMTGQHPNTIREHLDGLTEAGLVTRTRAAAQGRGRPAWLFSAAREAGSGSGSREYAALAAALASHIARTSRKPRVDAIEAGRAWGRELVKESRAGEGHPTGEAAVSPSATAMRRQVVTLVDGLGFAPSADARVSVIKLHRCPLLEAAHQQPEVVCGVHLGLVRGALDEMGAESERTESIALTPFSEPGACRLDMLPRLVPAQ